MNSPYPREEPEQPDESPSLEPTAAQEPASGELDDLEEWTIRRVLVALDASLNSRAALDEAARLAERLNSEIVGLFVEDINLVRLADLPFAREIRFAEQTVRQLGREELHRRLRARAAILKHELESIASEHKIPSSFRVIRGPVDRELLAAAVETDLLALGRLGHSVVRKARLGSTAQAIVSQATSAVMLVKAGVETGPVIALFDGSTVGLRVIRFAADIVGRSGDLRVLVWAADEQTAFDRRQLAVQLLKEHKIHVQYQHLSGDNPQQIIQWVNRQKASLLILAGRGTYLPDDIIQTLLDDAEQHILVIR